MPFLSINVEVNPILLDGIIRRVGDTFLWCTECTVYDDGKEGLRALIIIDAHDTEYNFHIRPNQILAALSNILNSTSLFLEYGEQVSNIMNAVKGQPCRLYNEEIDLIYQIACFGFVKYPINY